MAEQRSAMLRLESRIRELQELQVESLERGDEQAVTVLEQRIRSTLASLYGENSEQYARLGAATNLDLTSYAINFGEGDTTTIFEIREGIQRGRQRAIAILQGEVDALREHLEFSSHDVSEPVPTPSAQTIVISDDVFIVHGRDEAAKETVARVIQRAGLKPVILHEQPNNGKTIIEKFEKHGTAAGFAVVIATPDDVGGLAVLPPAEPQLSPRARQNVIGEMFWFAGKLGRDRVCALVKGDIEMPSDFAGVVYTPMDPHGGWKGRLLQELNAAGYTDLDWQAALS
ncbi:nucleotide-binding protein [Bradyrhizobium daqingense]|uniref:TIR domain-containing protein n=1 Tax=Bradyrhizobium daqingense TaxID=993502 RepID=UPI001315543C|nr:nucleotide-binding protein [Bradyrhizobium daqingense]UFS87295.1 nucleotide-binding protein [Bradyrhizobium daqingense]